MHDEQQEDPLRGNDGTVSCLANGVLKLYEISYAIVPRLN